MPFVKLAKIFPWKYPWVAELLAKKRAEIETGCVQVSMMAADRMNLHVVASFE